MVIISPLTAAIGLGGADLLLGGLGAISSAAAARQDYANQLAFQDASTRFARWQAGFNVRLADANARYSYWQDTVNYNQQRAYTASLRNFETLKAIEQARVVGETRAAAGGSFVLDSQALSDSASEASMQEAVAFQQYQMAAIQARARVVAADQEGVTIDRLISDYDRQVGDYQAIQAINQGLRKRQYSRQQAAAVTEYLSRYNSQGFYSEQPFMEPVAPFAPLPALLEPPPPSMTGAPPSRAAAALQIGSSLLSGVQTGLNVYSGLRPGRRSSG